ncbi:ATP-grasp domain-containing protein [Allostreptomyces psammosilenae]|uniref:ATP-grasp domain-containing protein n=1 Tax=Allostreptomyces psammosilenae TaxID=1892865 RepID=A0A852ZQT7_9ACTN|nr:ATP-grasp domain-containing protein [Allostreptomyces psammosilenae]NYI04763.1 hypothetical protein [Allostreptomyces psammosilenae]
MGTAVLYCGDPLRPRRVDPHFAAEAESVRRLGGVVARIDHDALVRGEVERAVEGVPIGLGSAWYRGWMVSAAQYDALAVALRDRGCRLLVSPERYRTAHELPGWYRVFEELTPLSVWTPSAPGVVPSPGELAALVAPLGAGPAVVKDYVKSRKHEWDDACFVPEVTDTAGLRRVVARFVELQGDALAGGIVVRAFERFAGAGGGGAPEARVWWVDGEPVVVGPHPDTSGEAPRPELERVRPVVRRLGCRFVTTDLVARTDGEWRVVEVGDGQVSDLPRRMDPSALMEALLSGGRG